MILTLLATIGGAIAASATTVATTVAASAAAIGAFGASALAAASAIGATTLIGGITIGSVLAWGGGLFAVAAISGAMAEDARNEGIKEGYGKASRAYEAKLRDQAKEFFTQIAALKKEIESYRLQRDQARALARRAFTLLGKFEICISETREQGRDVTDETLGYYKQLKDFTDKAA